MICKRATLAPPARVLAMYSTPSFVGLGCSVLDPLEPEIYIHTYIHFCISIYICVYNKLNTHTHGEVWRMVGV